MSSSYPELALQLGQFASPPVVVGTLVVLLIILLVGRFVIGIAWKVVVIALVAVISLWALGALGTVLNLVG